MRLVKQLYNYTNDVIYLYEEHSGDICKIKPRGELSISPSLSADNSSLQPVLYVVDEKGLNRLKKCGRKLDDFAVIQHKSPGRHHKLISYLVLAKDMRTPVRLY